MNVKKFVINLDRRKDRYKEFINNCPYKEVERVSAFDGMFPLMNKHLDFYNFIKNAFPNLMSAEYGCWVSHLKIWKKIIDDDLPYAIIFEDDPIFCKNFKEKCDRLIKENIDNIDTILYIGGKNKPDVIIDKRIDLNENLLKYDYNAKWNGICHFGTFCYFITKKICKYFMNCLMLKIKLDNAQVDCFMLNMLKLKKYDIFCAKPFLCHGIIESENSDISPKQRWQYQIGGPTFPIKLLNQDKNGMLNPGLMKYTINLCTSRIVKPISEKMQISNSPNIQNLFRLTTQGTDNSVIDRELRWRKKEDERRQRMMQNFKL